MRYSCLEEDFASSPAGIGKTATREEKSHYPAHDDGADGMAVSKGENCALLAFELGQLMVLSYCTSSCTCESTNISAVPTAEAY